MSSILHTLAMYTRPIHTQTIPTPPLVLYTHSCSSTYIGIVYIIYTHKKRFSQLRQKMGVFFSKSHQFVNFHCTSSPILGTLIFRTNPHLVPYGLHCTHLHVTVCLCIEVTALHGYFRYKQILDPVWKMGGGEVSYNREKSWRKYSTHTHIDIKVNTCIIVTQKNKHCNLHVHVHGWGFFLFISFYLLVCYSHIIFPCNFRCTPSVYYYT